MPLPRLQAQPPLARGRTWKEFVSIPARQRSWCRRCCRARQQLVRRRRRHQVWVERGRPLCCHCSPPTASSSLPTAPRSCWHRCSHLARSSPRHVRSYDARLGLDLSHFDRLVPLTPRLASPPHRFLLQVKLSTKSFGSDAAAVAAQAFTAVKASLREVDLSDVLAGRPEAEALEALGIMCAALTADNGVTLDALDLSDNALGEKGVRAAGAALQGQTHLRHLALQNDGISEHAAAALHELLASRGSMRCLRLYNNMTGDAGALHIAKLLSQCPQLEDLRLVSSRVQTEGGTALATALSGLSGKALTRLDLCDNGLAEECGAPLAAVLTAHPRLSVVLLNEVSLCDDGVSALCAGLHHHPAVSRLELCCNEITPASAKNLAQVLPTLKHLTALRLAENELGDDGVVLLAAALLKASTPLEELDFSTNEVHGRGARAVGRAAASRKCAKLGLDGNAIGPAALAAVAKAIAAAGGKLGSMEDNDPDDDDDDDAEAEDAGADVPLDMSKATL